MPTGHAPTSDWVVVEDVPILDEHELRDEAGNLIAVIDEARLQDIAARNNARMQTGDEAPVVIGHTKDGVKETSQPEIVGFARDYKVKPFRGTGRKVLTATMRFFKDQVDKVRRFPRRSIELWLKDWKIDPISLLGATTPERDLGLLQLSHTAPWRYQRVLPLQYSRDNTDNPDGIPRGTQYDEQTQAVLSAFLQSDLGQFLQALMEAAQAESSNPQPPMQDPMSMNPSPFDFPPQPGLPQGPGMAPQGMAPGQGLPPGTMPPGGPGSMPPSQAQAAPDNPVRYGGSPAGGGNTYVPGTGGQGTYGPPRRMTYAAPGYPTYGPPAVPSATGHAAPVQYQADDADRVRLIRDRDQALLARYARAFELQQAQIEDMRVRFQRAERERDLLQLEAEGYLLDRVEELDYCQGMPEDYYQQHLSLIRKRYARAPVATGFNLPGRIQYSAPAYGQMAPTPPHSPGLHSREQMMEIANRALAEGRDFMDVYQSQAAAPPVPTQTF